MKEILNFLIEVNKLKEMSKTGWVLMKVKDPETIAAHTFRVAFATWLLSGKKNLNAQELLKIALSHDLCEVYAGDMTPFFYWDHLDRRKKKEEAILLKGVRLSQKEKEERGKIKFEKEKKSLSKLIFYLKPKLKKEIFSSWLEYENKISEEARFLKQVDRIETLLQSIEYFGTEEKTGGTSWWEGTEEIVEDPLLLEFLKVIQSKFYGKKFKEIKNEKELTIILDFLLEIGKLKRMPRLYWILRGVKKPETVAAHIFTLALMAWICGQEKKELNMKKLLKMALCHELSAVYTGDTTPYDRILPEDKKEREKILKKMIRFSKKEKEWMFLEDKKEEEKALKKLTSNLNYSLQEEMIKLWREYRTKSSPEGCFLSQLNVLAVLLQGLLYEKENKNFSPAPLWEWAMEVCDDPICLRLMEEMKEKFY